jgi:hypothetical protein
MKFKIVFAHICYLFRLYWNIITKTVNLRLSRSYRQTPTTQFIPLISSPQFSLHYASALWLIHPYLPVCSSFNTLLEVTYVATINFY